MSMSINGAFSWSRIQSSHPLVPSDAEKMKTDDVSLHSDLSQRDDIASPEFVNISPVNPSYNCSEQICNDSRISSCWRIPSFAVAMSVPSSTPKCMTMPCGQMEVGA